MPAFVTTHRLRFNDTDRLGHVNNAVFAVMLEQGRSELAAIAGLPIEPSGQALVIVRLELDFLREMGWPGDVQIETEVARLGGRSFTFRQRLVHGGELCARAETVLVVMDREARRAVPIDPWRESLERWRAPAP
ncbi:MAG TPA: thioesterase family protein [Acetobacteraceae bacterium]|jgi:acyl-CoA thioester hydrolase|nr:thioesterase family protein [Acetobacteraceae bacterium]